MKKPSKIALIPLAIFFVFGIIFSLINIITWKSDTDANQKIEEELKSSISELRNEDQETIYHIDFKLLKEKNSDTIAYLKVNNTNINHIVVRGNDNSYYLKHNFNKTPNIAGWIFSDFNNKFDGTDKNIVIFGHEISDGSMFGSLKNVINPDWYQNPENHLITLVTETAKYRYQVFSSYSIKPESYYINTNFKNDNEFSDFIKTLKSRSIYDYGTEVSADDKILTLSSCLNGNKSRVVLHAKLIKSA